MKGRQVDLTQYGLEPMITREQVAFILGCDLRTIDRKAKSGELKSYIFERHVRFKPSEVHAYIESQVRI